MEFFVLCCWVLSALSKCALWVGGQFKTGCYSILGARDSQPSVLQWWPSNPIVRAHSKAMCRKSDTSIIFNLFHKASSHQTAAGDVFFLQNMLRVALLINFCACSIEACSPPPKPMKGKGNVLKQQLFEAYLPNLLQRRFKQRRQVKRGQQVKKKVGPKTNSEKNSEVWWTGGSERTKILNPSHTEYF